MKTKYGKALPNAYGHMVISGGKYRGKRLHRLIYEDTFKIKIPDDYDIHHIDEDKTNNDINNLVLMTHEDHTILHKSNLEWRVIKKGINEYGEQLYALYSPTGEKVRTSTNKDKLLKSLEKRKKAEELKDNEMEEKPKHELIFEKYYEMGTNRSLTKLSKETGYNLGTLSRWNNAFNWNERIDYRDNGMLQMKNRDRIEANIEARGVYQDVIRNIMREQVIEPLMNGTLDIEVKNVSDIKRLIELDNMLANEDKNDNIDNALDDNDKDVIELIENDAGAWEMLTEKLREKQKN